MFVVIGHASKINKKIYEAPVNTIIELLDEMNKKYLFIRHFFNNDLDSEIIGDSKVNKITIISNNNLLRYWKQLKATSALLQSINGDIIVIAANPLNALSAIIAKRKRKFNTKIIFYSADYSTKRFNNLLLDFIYIELDKFVAKLSDLVWSVSTRIQDIRRKQGLLSAKNLFLPNVPSISVIKKSKILHNHPIKLITLGVLDKQLEYTKLFKSIKLLKNKVKLTIVGTGPAEHDLKQEVEKFGLSKSVIFAGFVPHKDALELIADSDIGLALYNGKWSFNYYGDSMKCREYLCFGLPVITTDTHSTVDELTALKAGVIVELNTDSIALAINKIIEEYSSFSKNALSLAQKYDGAHKKEILKLL